MTSLVGLQRPETVWWLDRAFTARKQRVMGVDEALYKTLDLYLRWIRQQVYMSHLSVFKTFLKINYIYKLTYMYSTDPSSFKSPFQTVSQNNPFWKHLHVQMSESICFTASYAKSLR